MPQAFVTVGATAEFDLLLEAVLSPEILTALKKQGFDSLEIQSGTTKLKLPGSHFERDGIRVEVWNFKESLSDPIKKADLVISHAGAGTILDVLRLGKPLVVVPNPSLMDDHQTELALALERKGHLKMSKIESLSQAIESLPLDFVPFPAFDGSKFRELLDEEMGFPKAS